MRAEDVDRVAREAERWLRENAGAAPKGPKGGPVPFPGNGSGPRPAGFRFEDEEAPSQKIPICPAEAIDGDLIGEMTRALTDGTFVPPIFVRENIKVILGAVINGRVGLPSHPNIHTRSFHMMVSPNPQAGKEESWNRTGGKIAASCTLSSGMLVS